MAGFLLHKKKRVRRFQQTQNKTNKLSNKSLVMS
nr:MAG TPA: hypothetical protein [Caudoviricetes sp.]